jgi:hypothetical protein
MRAILTAADEVIKQDHFRLPRDIGVRVFDVIHDMLAGDRRPTPVDRELMRPGQLVTSGNHGAPSSSV